MFKLLKVQRYLGNMFDLGRDTVSRMDQEDYVELTVNLIREMPIKYLPKLADYDHDREIMSLLANWIETEDENDGHKLLYKMREVALKAFAPAVEDEVRHYAFREAKAKQTAKKDAEHLIYQDNKQRI